MSVRGRMFSCVLLLTMLAVFATATARELYEYSDLELTGPVQPIAFSHRVHATDFKIDCLYCHDAAAKSQHANLPSVGVCMGCHQWIKKGASKGTPEEVARSAEEIAKIQDLYSRGESIPWVRIHGVPEHVQFKHDRHTRVNVECAECHGPVDTMHRAYMTPDTKFRPRSLWLPAAKLEMGWCIDCHEDEKRPGSIDCVACHY